VTIQSQSDFAGTRAESLRYCECEFGFPKFRESLPGTEAPAIAVDATWLAAPAFFGGNRIFP
jgi:hypothetical protein